MRDINRTSVRNRFRSRLMLALRDLDHGYYGKIYCMVYAEPHEVIAKYSLRYIAV